MIVSSYKELVSALAKNLEEYCVAVCGGIKSFAMVGFMDMTISVDVTCNYADGWDCDAEWCINIKGGTNDIRTMITDAIRQSVCNDGFATELFQSKYKKSA